VAPPALVAALDLLAVNSYTCVAEFTQLAAIEALRDRDQATPRMVAEFHRRRDPFVRDLDRIPGFRCAPPEGAFYAWVNVAGTGIGAEEVCRIPGRGPASRRSPARRSACRAATSSGSRSSSSA
jgi:aspartate/methionine/tyrosine aminotransferase